MYKYYCSQTHENITGIPPVVVVPRHLPVPIRGQQFIIPCTIDSSQIPLQDVQWIYINWDGITIDPINITSPLTVKYEGSSVDSPSLVINDYQSSDDGRYMCRATNAWGNDVSPAVLVTLESKLTYNDFYIQIFPYLKYLVDLITE